MRSPFFAAALATALLSTPALAGNGSPEPGSLLVFPLIEGTGGSLTAVTVTNTNTNFSAGPGGLFAGTVDVEYVYINGDPVGGIFYCQESNRTRRLTPNDTLTVASTLDNTAFPRGYLYVFAKSPTSGQAISWNYLIGEAFFISDLPEAYAYNPYVFRSGRALTDGAPTDTNQNQIRDLNGGEYERVVDKLMVPHFWGEGIDRHGYLVLLNLSGASQFEAIVNLLIYNDSEVTFSGQTSFRCWTKRQLSSISGAFTQGFLESTSNSPSEVVLGTKSGWYRLDGGVAYSTADQIDQPAILALQVSGWRRESPGLGSLPVETCAELPFSSGLNPTAGELISYSPFHD